MEALARGYLCRYVTLDELVRDLRRADQLGSLRAKLSHYQRPHLLIVDEVGYLPLNASQAALLFEVVSQRYEHGSIVLTNNKSFGQWAEVFSGDEVLASAILDRLLHHSHVISIRRESYRLKDKRKAETLSERNRKTKHAT